MSLFWLRTTDKTKADQFQLFYREFVACQDGPRPANRGGTTNINSHLEVISGDATRLPKTKSILNLTDLGQFTKKPGKTIPLSGSLQVSHPINGYNFTLKPVVLNFKTSNETLDYYKGLLKPDPDPNKAIAALKCTDAGQDESSPTVPYGPIITPTTPTTPGRHGGKSFDDAKLIQDNELSVDSANEDQPS